MIRNEHDLEEQDPGVALVVNVDGFGDPPNKIAKYREFTATCAAATTASSSSTTRT